MPTVHEGTLAGWETLVLTDTATGAYVELLPERGALVARFDVGERRLLALDEATLEAGKNVRGGIPVLFPTPGKLRDDRWERDGKSGTLPQHGFARTLPWRVIGTLNGAVASVALRLDWPGDPRWPWACTFELTVSLRGAVLRLDQRIENKPASLDMSRSPMPFGVGFHPYFHVADKTQARVETRATRAFDNVTKQMVTPNLDFGAKELDLHLYDHGSSRCALELPGYAIALNGSSEFSHWVLWTLAGKDFICVEPWTCPGDAMNSGEKLLTVEENQPRALWLEIALEER